MAGYPDLLKQAMDRVAAAGGPEAFRLGSTPDPSPDGATREPPVYIDPEAVIGACKLAAFERIEAMRLGNRADRGVEREDPGP